MAAGVFVTVGAGTGGTVSGATLRVGSGNGDALRLLLLFAFAFVFAFALATGLMSSIASGETAAFAFGLACLVPFVAGVAASKSYWDLRSTGTTSWDRKKYRVSHGSISALRYCLIVSLGLVAVLLRGMWRMG